MPQGEDFLVECLEALEEAGEEVGGGVLVLDGDEEDKIKEVLDGKQDSNLD